MNSKPRTGTRVAAVTGLTGVFLLVGLFGAWSATTPIAGAVVSQGRIVVEGRTKTVQHRDGGTIAALDVRDGDRVAAGQMLIRLDPAEAEDALDLARDRLSVARARHARLAAERSSATRIVVTEADGALPGFAERLSRQEEVRAARADARTTRQDRLAETLARLDAEDAGLDAQIDALREEIGYIDEEIDAADTLRDRGLSTRGPLAGLNRDRAARQGRLATLESQLSGIDIARRDAVLEARQIEETFLEEVVTELSATEAEIEELDLEIARLSDRLARMEIAAPAAGVVHELAVNTVGGVIAPGDTILQIVPQDRDAAVEVRIYPDVIDRVRLGQTAELVFSALDRDQPPRLDGEVTKISPAAITDPSDGREFYRAEITVPADAFAGIDLTPMPGLPAEVYLTTGARSVLSYLMDPVQAHLRRTFKE